MARNSQKMKACAKALPCTIFALLACGQTGPTHGQASKDIAAALSITNLVFTHTPIANNPTRENASVTFTVTNMLSQPLVAYSASVYGTKNAGSRPRRYYGCEADLTFAIDMDAARLPKNVLPPMEPGASRTCTFTFSAPADSLPTAMVAAPVYVVGLDSSALGDRQAAMDSFFRPRQAEAAVYARHLTELGSIDKSSGLATLAALAGLYKNYQSQSHLHDSPGADSADAKAGRAADLARLNIAGALVAVNAMQLKPPPPGVTPPQPALEVHAALAQAVLAKHTAEIQRRLDNATRYSHPRESN